MNRFKKWFKVGIGLLLIESSLIAYRLNKRGSIGCCLYSVYIIILRWLNMSLLTVVDAKLYSDKTKSLKSYTIDNNRIGVYGNTVFARSGDPSVLVESSLPDLNLHLYRDVCIQGNSDVIVDVNYGYAVSEIAYNMDANEDVVDGLLYRTKDNICLLRDNLRHRKESIPSGIMISGKFCKNYYHLVFENLIRLVYVDSLDIPETIPLIVDRETMDIPSCRRIIEILTEKNKRVIQLIDNDVLYHFDELYSFSRVNLLPSNVVDPRKPIKVLYSPPALSLMKDSLIKKKANRDCPKRFFISRRNGGGRQFNEDEVFEVLRKHRFERIAPEQFSFEEQMALFNSAEYIVAGSGAALTNLLFVSGHCTVICFGLGSYEDSFEIPVFNTIAMINGASFVYFPRKNGLKKDIHINFEINCEDFEDWISTMNI